MASDRSVGGRIRERAHADLPEPHDVTRIMVLQADVTHLGTLWLAFGLEPLALTPDAPAFGIEAGDPLALDIHQDPVAQRQPEPTAGRTDYSEIPMRTAETHRR